MAASTAELPAISQHPLAYLLGLRTLIWHFQLAAREV
ncbi:MAG: hypothetical protein JWO17_2842 [Actinomycetia bacterium]|nr:hypothetical protein [Actinomycetes bacterium]